MLFSCSLSACDIENPSSSCFPSNGDASLGAAHPLDGKQDLESLDGVTLRPSSSSLRNPDASSALLSVWVRRDERKSSMIVSDSVPKFNACTLIHPAVVKMKSGVSSPWLPCYKPAQMLNVCAVMN